MGESFGLSVVAITVRDKRASVLKTFSKMTFVSVFLQGKLGHGDMSRASRPTVIEALRDVCIRKVACGSQSNLALSTSGQVYSWGSGPCLGSGSAEAIILAPRIIEDLSSIRIVDISFGDSHCLALSNGRSNE